MPVSDASVRQLTWSEVFVLLLWCHSASIKARWDALAQKLLQLNGYRLPLLPSTQLHLRVLSIHNKSIVYTAHQLQRAIRLSGYAILNIINSSILSSDMFTITVFNFFPITNWCVLFLSSTLFTIVTIVINNFHNTTRTNSSTSPSSLLSPASLSPQPTHTMTPNKQTVLWPSNSWKGEWSKPTNMLLSKSSLYELSLTEDD